MASHETVAGEGLQRGGVGGQKLGAVGAGGWRATEGGHERRELGGVRAGGLGDRVRAGVEGQSAQGVGDGAVGELSSGELHAVAEGDRVLGVAIARQRLVQKAGLPDASFTFDHDRRGGAVPGSGNRLPEDLELLVAANETTLAPSPFTQSARPCLRCQPLHREQGRSHGGFAPGLFTRTLSHPTAREGHTMPSPNSRSASTAARRRLRLHRAQTPEPARATKFLHAGCRRNRGCRPGVHQLLLAPRRGGPTRAPCTPVGRSARTWCSPCGHSPDRTDTGTPHARQITCSGSDSI